MTSSKIKPSQLTRVGYTYQDLMCIRMLINWFHDPEKYQWMIIEGNHGLSHVKSLDDVICYTAEGEYELYQVKFTIDSERDDLRLDFDWLLKKKSRGTSLIEKWSADVEKFGSSNGISIAKLITNRIPDQVLSNCLKDKKIEYSLIPDDIKLKVSDQLGSEEKAINFFSTLIFEHSQREIDDLELQLHDSLVPDHANNESWLQLLKTVERWATRKSEPAPDGRIYLKHIHDILSIFAKKTISQFFEVPGGYRPPTEEFYYEVIKKVTNPGCHVISGLPGMGKSTFLSFLTDQLIEAKTPVIRHHYYLSPQFIGDRIAFNNAAQSLQSQIKTFYPNDFDSDKLEPQNFETWISKAADKAEESNKKLVIIIDGLDHVYRERSDISQLEHLVNRIIPFKNKICLLFGTQPISDNYLPNSLLRSAPRESAWIDIPPMGLDAIKSRLDFIVSREEIKVVGDDEHQRREIVEISETLLDISHGYPLHIIYSLNSLQLANQNISKYDVERLPTCPDGDIHEYYENLWVSLSEGAKEILFLIANADFSWPDKTHISYCLDDSLTFQSCFSEIQHLIEQRLSGIYSFHGSLFVYIRRKDTFSQSRDRLNRISQTWINAHAPEYWRWGWGWIIEANLGNTNPLFQGINKEWLVKSLCNGYPLEHIEHIFSVAEHIAFDQNRYPELLRLRILKTRLLNGPEFQIQKYSDFLDCSLSISNDSFGLLWRADNLRIIPDNEIAIVAKHFQGRDERIVDACADEIYRRIRFYAQLDDSNQYQTLNSLVDDYLHTLASYSNPDLDIINNFYERLNDKASSFTKIVELLIQYGHRHLLVDLSRFEIPDDIASAVCDEVVLAANVEGITLDAKNPLFSSADSNIYLLYQLLAGKVIQIEQLDDIECPVEYEDAHYLPFYEYFFRTLISEFWIPDEIDTPKLSDPKNIQEFLKNAWLTFQFASSKIAKIFKEGGRFETLDLYDSFTILKQPDKFLMGYKIDSVLYNIRKSIAKITIHLNILYNSIDAFSEIDKEALDFISNNTWWDSRIFFDVASHNAILNFPKESIAQEFIKIFESEILRRDDTATLANDSLDLAKLAVNFGLHNEARKFLERTALNIVGYGYRKDITLHEVFEAIQECSDKNSPKVPDWLKRVATFTSDVFDFSEREIQHIPGWFTKLLAKHIPERLVDEFDYHLSEENWHRTHLILENFVKSFPLSMQPEHSLLRCMTTSNAMSALDERSKDNDILRSIYEDQCKVLGGIAPQPKERLSSTDDVNTDCPDVSTLHPSNLTDLREALLSISYQIRKKFISDWISYWDNQGEARFILTSFSDYYDQNDSDNELDRYLHNVFLLSKKKEGKTAAYKWAVRNIKLNNCWNRYFSSGSEAAIKEYGDTYSNQWENLLRDTMASGSSSLQSDENIIVPSTQLVTYLVSAGQVALATEITEIMVTSLESDIAHLPLTKLYWYDIPVSFQSIPLHLILLHFKWPDRYARLLTAKQIAILLQDESNIEFRSLYLDFLAKQPYEIDIVDYLSVLLLVDSIPFVEENITKCIHYPSLISDELLLFLGFGSEERQDFSTLYSEFSDDSIPNKRKYDKYANGLALRFIDVIKGLENEYQIQLERHFLLEWEKIHERHYCYTFKPQSFSSDQFYAQDNISCSFSWRAEASILSAYVRTLAYAMSYNSIPSEVCLLHAQEVLPFGSIAVKINPSDPPCGWPVLGDLNKQDPVPGQKDLEQYLANVAASTDEILLRADGPVLRNHSGVCLDLEVILVSLQDSEIDDPRIMFDSLNHARNAEEGIFPLAKWTLPHSFGRWEIDWLSRGYFRPAYAVGDFPINSVSQSDSCVEYFGGNISNGVWRYWVNQWYPVHHRGVGNSFGTYFTVSKDFFEKFKAHTGCNYYLIAEMTCVDRRDFVRNVEPIKTFAILPV
ncbi:AAA family ATPase [Proteus mirabilis]|uniref:ATP-binding protein n=1 Tax=Gammaproteobacteria TaxID=1236 RepID=UPI00126209F5|nr:ATP-binding protein [Proteus mirabilis]KAB7723805.1 AAA family ATPase [Proteus mirabilis]HAI7058856.1 ATP-binding protein [Escherichia coli]